MKPLGRKRRPIHIGRLVEIHRAEQVGQDVLSLLVGVAQILESRRHALVRDLEVTAARELLELHEREVRLYARRVAIHQQTDGTGGSQHGDLRVAVAVLLAERQRQIPVLASRAHERGRRLGSVDAVSRIAMLRDHAKHGVAVLVEASERAHHRGFFSAHRVSVTAHDGRQRSGPSPTLIGVVGNALEHEECPEIGVAQAQRPIVMRVLGDTLRRIAREVHEQLLADDEHAASVPIRFYVERTVFLQELHQIQRRQVAGRIIEEHVLRAGVRGVDAVGIGRGVPIVDRRVVLNAWICAGPSGFRHHLPERARLISLHDLVLVGPSAGRPLLAPLHGTHELIGHAHGVVGVLTRDRAIGFAIEVG